MTVINLRICKGSDNENRSGCQSIFTVKYLIRFQRCYRHRTKIANTKIVKICSEAKMLVLNVNLRSEISYEAI